MRSKDMYNVGIYCRLSRDDGNTESNSIANQKLLLTNYVTERGWNITDTYVDDGYTGTNFQRPNFLRMISDIEAGRIDLVITKDLSRLGREHIWTGYYQQMYFPQNHVRYIAVIDNYDSNNQNCNDIMTPIHNLMNEMYAGDISKKVRSMRKTSARQGFFMGSIPPYGYLKSPTDRHKLIVDENVAHIVKRIFNMYAAGHSARSIANQLNNEGLPSPSEYHYCHVRKGNNPHGDKLWGSASISLILKNQVHIGNMAQGKHTMISFKSNLREYNAEEDWIVVEGTHEAIIDRDVWDAVQKRILAEKRTKVTKTGELSLFSGMLRCADCGAAMSFTSKSMRGKTYYLYRCRSYANSGKSACSIHSTPIESLSEVVLSDIKQYAVLANKDMETLTKILAVKCNKNKERQLTDAQARASEIKKRLKELDAKAENLFNEKCEGNIPANIFKTLLFKIEAEKEALTKEATIVNSELNELRNDFDNVSNWVDTVKKYVRIKELDRDVVTDLIDRIEISEAVKSEGITQRNIAIYYKFVGCLEQEKSERVRFA